MKLLVLLLTLAVLNATSGKPINGTPSTNLPRRTTGKLIVKLKKNANARKFDQDLKSIIAKDTSAGPGDNVITHRYTSLNGYAGKFSDAVAGMLSSNPAVEAVEEDVLAHLDDFKVQKHPPTWGLPRLAKRERDLAMDYVYPDVAGDGITAYVVDSGIDITHPEFEGRAFNAFNAVPNEPFDDYSIHGTSVASYLGGKTLGTAKNVRLASVRICNKQKECPLTNILAALDWISKNATPYKSVLNLSFTVPPSDMLDQAVDAAVAKGFAVIVSAGNTYIDACLESPRRTKNAFAVGSSDSDDNISVTTNWGPCVRLFAPGVNVLGALPGGDMAGRTGTSYSAPYVAGIAAVYMSQKAYPSIAQLYDDLVKRSTPGVIQGIPDSYYNTTTRLAFLGEESQVVVGPATRVDIPAGDGTIVVPVNGTIVVPVTPGQPPVDPRNPGQQPVDPRNPGQPVDPRNPGQTPGDGRIVLGPGQDPRGSPNPPPTTTRDRNIESPPTPTPTPDPTTTEEPWEWEPITTFFTMLPTPTPEPPAKPARKQ